MKKFLSLTAVLLLMFSLAAPAFADLGEPQFEAWYVFCGPEGFDFVDKDYDYDTGETLSYNEHLKPGTRLQVYSYNNDNGTYLLLPFVEYTTFRGKGFVYVTDNELNHFFYEEFESVPGEKGTKLSETETGKVSAQVGLVLRQGPHTNFPKYTTIPFGTELSYQYTYQSDGMTWAFVSYNGMRGWASTSYLTAAEPQTDKAETTSETTVETTEETSAAETTTAPEETEPETTVPAVSDGFFDNTTNVILVCCCGALLVAITALTTILIMRRKKQ